MALFKGLFGDKFQETWRGTSDKAGLADKLGVLGVGISQLSAGQAPNIMPAWQAVEDRRAKRKLSESMANPDLLAGFSPEQQSMLAMMPPELAQQVIMEKVFAPPPAPPKPEYREFGGDLYDMSSGTPQVVLSSPDAPAVVAPMPMSAEDKAMWGLGEGTYVMDQKTMTPVLVEGTLPAGAPGSVPGEFGLNPILGRDADGNTVIMQLGKDGTAVATKLPEGITPDIGLKAFETAQGNALGKGAGETQADAAAALPGVSGLAGLVDDQVKSLKEDPYLGEMLGPIDSRMPNVTEDAARVQGKIDQLQGGAFLQARQLLKGGGAITDIEGQKAEAAFVRMGAAQSVEDFNAALDEFNAAVQDGVKKLEAQAAGVGAAEDAKPNGASAMSDEDLLKFYGGE
ncbi:MAG: hypothetical protein ACRCXM_04590 [Beijerinckiaceae bacterium]